MPTDVEIPYAGVELGGTKCVAILARGPEEIIARQVVPTTSPEETLGGITQVLAGWHEQIGFEALGIASFGPVDVDPRSSAFGRILSTPKPGWAGSDVLGPLQRVADVATAIETDVNGAALAEMRWGAGRGFEDFAYITVGTGVGAGLIVNGEPTRGFAHSELGHIRVAKLADDAFNGICPFHGDCVEGLASGPAIKARIGDRSVDTLSTDDPIWRPVAWTIAQLCHAMVCAAAPRAIAIGGGVLERQPHLLARIEKMLSESLNGYVELPSGAPYIRAPGLGGDAGPLGAIALAMGAKR
jgi:fructokinase